MLKKINNGVFEKTFSRNTLKKMVRRNESTEKFLQERPFIYDFIKRNAGFVFRGNHCCSIENVNHSNRLRKIGEVHKIPERAMY